LLAKVPLFSLLDENELAALGQRIDEVHEQVGTTLFHAGDPGDALYVVLDGEVDVFVKNATGERLLLEHARPGDFFGEISLLDAGPRTASAVVTRELHALVVDRGDLQQFLLLCPAATMDLLGAMGKRLRETARILRRATSTSRPRTSERGWKRVRTGSASSAAASRFFSFTSWFSPFGSRSMFIRSTGRKLAAGTPIPSAC
jgi:CRP-like cAMP-binding protein